MRQFLVVGNQTLGSEQLYEAMRERIAAGPCGFHVVVPATAPEHGFWSEGEAHAVAQQRLDAALAQMRAGGATVDGEVGDANPILAVEDVLRRVHVDEIILSTLPVGPSRWIHQDLPRRLAKRTGLPLCHVVAAVRQPEAAR